MQNNKDSHSHHSEKEYNKCPFIQNSNNMQNNKDSHSHHSEKEYNKCPFIQNSNNMQNNKDSHSHHSEKEYNKCPFIQNSNNMQNNKDSHSHHSEKEYNKCPFIQNSNNMQNNQESHSHHSEKYNIRKNLSNTKTLFVECINSYNLYDKSYTKIDDHHLLNFTNDSILRNENNYYNENIYLGYAFLNEFIYNDITFNYNNECKFNLDSIYGKNINYLYNNNKFCVNNKNHDLLRNKQGIALIPDFRNDCNYILSQLHYIFLLFHNKLINYYLNKNKNIKNIFEYTKQQVIYYYQWIIVNDFLPKIIDNDILNKIFKNEVKKNNQNISNEFDIIFKYNSFIMPNYYNIALDLNISYEKILYYTKGKLPKYVIDWSNFFKIIPNKKPKLSKKINTKLSFYYAGAFDTNIYYNYLLQSQKKKIQSGQNISKILKIKPLDRSILNKYDYNSNLKKYNMLNNTPLLIYILMESDILKCGHMLTGIGGTIIAEYILGNLFNDSHSYFNSNKWLPTLPSFEKGEFSMADLIRFVYDVN